MRAQVAVKAPLVELVEDHQANSLKRRIVEDDPGEDAFGDQFDPGPRAHPGLVAHPKAHGAAHLLAQSRGHAPCRSASGQAAGLEHHYPPAPEPWLVEKREWNPGRLPGARWGLEQHRDAGPERPAKLGKHGIDR